MKRGEEDDYFGKLPDDVIIDIFDRVNDSKLLTQCLLVSKRIASLIRLVSSVFINIHLGHVKQNPTDQGSNCNRVWLQCKIISLSQPDDRNSSWWDAFLLNDLASLYKYKAREALQAFSKVKKAVVLNKYFSMDTLKWMIEYSGGGVNIIKSCAVLTPIHNPLGCKIINFWVASVFRLACTFLPMVGHMVDDHESLSDVLIITPSRNGFIHTTEDEIVKMRQEAGGSADKLMMMMEKKVNLKVKVWYIPVPNDSIYYVYVVASSSDNIDREVKTVTRRFWSDSSYWAGHHEDVIQEAGIERKLRELVETKPCNFEYVWEGIMKT